MAARRPRRASSVSARWRTGITRASRPRPRRRCEVHGVWMPCTRRKPISVLAGTITTTSGSRPSPRAESSSAPAAFDSSWSAPAARPPSFPNVRANQRRRDASSFGVLELRPRLCRLRWRFRPAVGWFSDSGSAGCTDRLVTLCHSAFASSAGAGDALELVEQRLATRLDDPRLARSLALVRRQTPPATASGDSRRNHAPSARRGTRSGQCVSPSRDTLPGCECRVRPAAARGADEADDRVLSSVRRSDRRGSPSSPASDAVTTIVLPFGMTRSSLRTPKTTPSTFTTVLAGTARRELRQVAVVPGDHTGVQQRGRRPDVLPGPGSETSKPSRGRAPVPRGPRRAAWRRSRFQCPRQIRSRARSRDSTTLPVDARSPRGDGLRPLRPAAARLRRSVARHHLPKAQDVFRRTIDEIGSRPIKRPR